MKMKMFALRDSKTAAFGNPMCFQARGQAMRSVSDEVNRRNGGSDQATVLQQHPEDFELYELGEYDTDTGRMEGVPQSVCVCSDFRLSSN